MTFTPSEIEAVARAVHRGDWWDSDQLPIGDRRILLYRKAREHGRYLARQAIQALDYVRYESAEIDSEPKTEAQRLSYEKGLWEAHTIVGNHALIPSDGNHPAFEAGWRDAALEIQTEIEELIVASRKARGLE